MKYSAYLNQKFHLKGLLINVILFLEAIFLILCFFAFVNLLGLRYPDIIGDYNRLLILNLNLFSPQLDKSLIYILSGLNILIVCIMEIRKRKFYLFYLNAMFFSLGFIVFQYGFKLSTSMIIIIGLINMFSFLFLSKLVLSQKKITLRIFVYICCVFVVIDLLSAVLLVSYPFYPWLPNARQYRPLWRFVTMETQIFFIPSFLVSSIILLIFLTWPIKPLKRILERSNVYFKIQKSRIVQVTENIFSLRYGNESESMLRNALVLVASMVLSMFFIIYPYLLRENPFAQSGWVDLPHYVDFLIEMDEAGINGISYALTNYVGRFLSIFVLFVLWKATGLSTWTVVRFTPLILAPILVLSAYYFMRQSGKDLNSMYLAPLFASLSINITVGLGLGFLSNFMGLIILFFFSGFLLKALREGSWKWVSAAVLTMTLLLFTHAWTWGLLMGVLVAFILLLGIKWLWTREKRVELGMLGAIVLVNVVVDLIKNYALRSRVGVFSEVVSVGGSQISLLGLKNFWSILDAVIHVGNPFFNNSIIMFLSFLGAIIVLSEGSYFNDYMVSWLGVSSIPFIFGARTLKYRLLYNMPFQFLAPVALSFIINKIQRHAEPFEGKMITIIVVTLLTLMNVNYVLRCLIEISTHMG